MNPQSVQGYFVKATTEKNARGEWVHRPPLF